MPSVTIASVVEWEGLRAREEWAERTERWDVKREGWRNGHARCLSNMRAITRRRREYGEPAKVHAFLNQPMLEALCRRFGTASAWCSPPYLSWQSMRFVSVRSWVRSPQGALLKDLGFVLFWRIRQNRVIRFVHRVSHILTFYSPHYSGCIAQIILHLFELLLPEVVHMKIILHIFVDL